MFFKLFKVSNYFKMNNFIHKKGFSKKIISLSSAVTIFLSPVYADFGAVLEKEHQEELAHKRLMKRIRDNDKELKSLFKKNLAKIKSLYGLMKYRKCYTINLSIREVKNSDEYSWSEKQEMIRSLASKCPNWKKFNPDKLKGFDY